LKNKEKKRKFNNNNNNSNNLLNIKHNNNNKDSKFLQIYLTSQPEKCQCQAICKESKSMLTLSSKINHLKRLVIIHNKNNNNHLINNLSDLYFIIYTIYFSIGLFLFECLYKLNLKN